MAKNDKSDQSTIAPSPVVVTLDGINEGGSYLVNPETGAVERVAFMQTNRISVQALVDQQAASDGASKE